jgi:diguanylate cyclase (GGDEF)-like protein
MKLTITKKLLAAYLLIVFLTILIGSFAIYSLQNLNELAYSILKKDFLVIYYGRQMIDNLLGQDRAEKKFLILKEPALEELFWERSKAFTEGVKKLKRIDFPRIENLVSQVEALYADYIALFKREVELIAVQQAEDATRLSEGSLKDTFEILAKQVSDIQKKAEADVDEKMNLISKQGIKASSVTTILFLISLCGGVSLALFITYAITRPLKKLQKATGFIADGNFDYNLKIQSSDEIGDLANRFRVMAERLKVLEQLHLDASPLTRLPGNIAIEKTIEEMLKQKKPFSLCHVDLDNFKPFADNYGYAWASEIIKEVADILTGTIATCGAEKDFIGHIGGDDFIIITEPDRVETICQEVVTAFDKRLGKFYDAKDREEGFITGKDRRGTAQKFPLMTLSIGIVSDDGSRFENPLVMARTAADVKEYAKAYPVSNYVRYEDMQKQL